MSKRTTLILAAAVIAVGALVLSASDAPNDTRPARVGPGRRGAGPKRLRRLTEEQEQELLKFLADKRPEYHKHPKIIPLFLQNSVQDILLPV